MPKALCFIGMVVAVLLLLFFGLDAITAMLLDSGFPFGGVSMTMDILFVICAGMLAYISWTTYREQR